MTNTFCFPFVTGKRFNPVNIATKQSDVKITWRGIPTKHKEFQLLNGIYGQTAIRSTIYRQGR